MTKRCQVFFTENDRTARRFFKKIWKEMVIDDYEWHSIHEITQEVISIFKKAIQEKKTVGILSEAGCPGIADPGQELVAIAQEMDATVRPLVGPNSILLALMASGMNGQNFHFHGYLPIKEPERTKTLRNLEDESRKSNSTQIFIETPYRNNQLVESMTKALHPSTLLSIAVDITSQNEWIKTKTIAQWKSKLPDIHKRPAIFCMLSSSKQ